MPSFSGKCGSFAVAGDSLGRRLVLAWGADSRLVILSAAELLVICLSSPVRVAAAGRMGRKKPGFLSDPGAPGLLPSCDWRWRLLSPETSLVFTPVSALRAQARAAGRWAPPQLPPRCVHGHVRCSSQHPSESRRTPRPPAEGPSAGSRCFPFGSC